MDTVSTTARVPVDEGVEPSRSANPRFAVALGGGGARGLAHIHVVEALDELGIRPVAISGSSIGAIIGAGMAAGLAGRDIREHAVSILGRSSEVMSRIWRARPETFAEMFAGGVSIGQFNAERIIRAFLPESVPSTFEELRVPLYTTATDYFGHEEVVFSQGDLVQAIAASSALPAVFRPVRHDGRLLIDGGVVNPVPFDLLEGMADIVIAVDVIGAPVDHGHRRLSSVELLFGASQIMMESIVTLKLKRTQPQVMLRPPVSHIGVLDFMKIERVLDETALVKEELKHAVEAAIVRFEIRAA